MGLLIVIKPLSDQLDQRIREHKIKLLDNYLFFDVETTGKDCWKNEIIEFAGILTDTNFKPVKTYYSRFKPLYKAWDKEAEKVHKIKRSELENEECKHTFFKQMLSEIGFTVMVFHAAKVYNYFDMGFLMAEMMSLNLQREFSKKFDIHLFYSTYDMAKARKLPVENNKLNTLCKYYRIELDHHKAESDAKACYELFKRLK